MSEQLSLLEHRPRVRLVREIVLSELRKGGRRTLHELVAMCCRERGALVSATSVSAKLRELRQPPYHLDVRSERRAGGTGWAYWLGGER